MDATEKETTDKVMESEPDSGNNKKPAVNSADMPSKGSADKETDSVVKALSDSEKIDNALAEGRKVVYLTYDDGPSANTEKLLDVLDQYGIKATFFVIKTPEYGEYVKEIVTRGHTLAMHSTTHDYRHVYESYDSFKEEVDVLSNYLTELTGFTPFAFRFPGGSSNQQTTLPIQTFIKYLDEKNIVYYDWNVSSGDGGSKELTVDEIYNNVIRGVEGKDISVVLMHDSEYRETTLQATPRIIEKLQEMDALILPITEDTVPVHHNI
jgi:peptidoglycan N-acetylglucosamine deacetylase